MSLTSYTPAQNPDFVGTETFTYTIGDGLGGTDQGLVQVTVEGSGNYFAFDNSYGIWEDDLLPLNVPAAAGVLADDGRPDIFPVLTPGNVLVTHSPTGSSGYSLLQEYTPAGVLVRSVELPSFTGASGDVRDLVARPSGQRPDLQRDRSAPFDDLRSRGGDADANDVCQLEYGGREVRRRVGGLEELCLRPGSIAVRREPAERHGHYPLRHRGRHRPAIHRRRQLHRFDRRAGTGCCTPWGRPAPRAPGSFASLTR